MGHRQTSRKEDFGCIISSSLDLHSNPIVYRGFRYYSGSLAQVNSEGMISDILKGMLLGRPGPVFGGLEHRSVLVNAEIVLKKDGWVKIAADAEPRTGDQGAI